MDPVTVERLAIALHYAGRRAVEQGKVLNKIPGQPFYEWHEIGEDVREGRRIQARSLLEVYDFQVRPGASA